MAEKNSKKIQKKFKKKSKKSAARLEKAMFMMHLAVRDDFQKRYWERQIG
jgi:hypothetical protein